MKYKIQEIKNKIDIVDFIGQYISLKQSGQNYIASCPFHNDSSPSFVVSKTRQIATCFGACNTTFDMFSFYEKYFKVNTSEAISTLTNYTKTAKRKNQLKQNNMSTIKPKFFGNDSEYIYNERFSIAAEAGDIPENICHQLALECLNEFYLQTQQRIYSSLVDFLKKDFDVDVYLYLVGPKRGLNPETIEKFSLCSIKNVNQTIEFLKDNFNQEEINISGLFSEKGNFVFYKHRILIPYIEQGNVFLIRGRYFFGGNEIPEGNCKYKSVVNRTGTLTSKRFYNIDILKVIESGGEILICEGEFDCAVMSQLGYPVIAIPGIAGIPDDIKCLSNFRVFLCLDNDLPGKTATKRIVQKILTVTHDLQIIKIKSKYKDLTEWVVTKKYQT